MPPAKKPDTEDLAAGVEAPEPVAEPVAEKTDMEKWVELYGEGILPPQRVREGFGPL